MAKAGNPVGSFLKQRGKDFVTNVKNEAGAIKSVAKKVGGAVTSALRSGKKKEGTLMSVPSYDKKTNSYSKPKYFKTGTSSSVRRRIK